MSDFETTTTIENNEKPPSEDVEYITFGNTTYEVVSKYVGKISIMDIVKSAIKRDVENGNY